MDIKKLIQEEVKRQLTEESVFVHPKDDLIRGMTFEELIITVQSNVRDINERTVRKEFEDALKEIVAEARYELKENMDFILKEAKY